MTHYNADRLESLTPDLAPPLAGAPFVLDDALLAERLRLVRLCAYLVGNPAVADDLAQETLVEAWRNAHKLTDPRGVAAWLSAIARNVCKRWVKQHGRAAARIADAPTAAAGGDPTVPPEETWPADENFDVEVELERGELVTLLDRALGQLTPDTRAALIERFVAESSVAEVAAKLGLTEGTAAVRLHRGKLALRKVLTTTLRAEAAAFGLVPGHAPWQLTQMWCPACGRHRLMGQLDADAGDLYLRCPRCRDECELDLQESQGLWREMGGARGFRTAFRRLAQWADGFYRPGLLRGWVNCTRCGRRVVPTIAEANPWDGGYYIDASCPHCNGTNYQSLSGGLWCTPEGQAFWRAHEQMRTVLPRTIEAEGTSAVVLSYEAIHTAARLDFVVATDNFRLLQIYPSHGA